MRIFVILLMSLFLVSASPPTVYGNQVQDENHQVLKDNVQNSPQFFVLTKKSVDQCVNANDSPRTITKGLSAELFLIVKCEFNMNDKVFLNSYFINDFGDISCSNFFVIQ